MLLKIGVPVVALLFGFLLGRASVIPSRQIAPAERFQSMQGAAPGFMFDRQTAQVCWAALAAANPSKPKVPLCKELQ